MYQVRKLGSGALPDGSSVNKKMNESVDCGQVGTGLNWYPSLQHMSTTEMFARSHCNQVRELSG